ncbi:glycosyltransferase [Oenococcus kitaharae]|uniref:glycosyltransferase family 2 protein n=1 Tax=Oenococcus TaxID=46254 RepID=UPI0021E74579|nr:glycosyltransferase [Oenococcus kitaharae]MCV3296567.1 glycosyltransferase [Oenococcus kitaharae]
MIKMSRPQLNPLISIIVPAHNAGEVMSLTVQSILQQSYADFELIIVDDGSTDSTKQICDQFCRSDSRVRYFFQENKGVSAARNAGITLSKGQFILFVDSDDTLETTMLDKLKNCFSGKDVDLAFCGFNVIGDDSRQNDMESLRQFTGTITREEVLANLISTDSSRQFLGYVWRFLFRRETIKRFNIFFKLRMHISEDFQFIVEYVTHCRKISVIPEKLYNYQIHTGSVTAHYIPSLPKDMISVNEWVRENILSIYPMLQEGWDNCVANTYLSIVQNYCRVGTPERIWKRVVLSYQIKKRYAFSKFVWLSIKSRGTRLKAKFALVLFVLNMDWLYVFLYSAKHGTLKKSEEKTDYE